MTSLKYIVICLILPETKLRKFHRNHFLLQLSFKSRHYLQGEGKWN